MASDPNDPWAWPDLPISEIFELQDPFKFLHALVGSMYLKLEASGSASWNRFNSNERAILAIWELKGEVDNGGFAQYFFNDSAIHAWEAVPALELVGAVNTAEIVRRALSVFLNGAPSGDSDVRDRQLEKVGEKERALWRALGTEFYKDPDDLEKLIYKYCHANPKPFGA
jgi:hypothetical protein